MARKKNANRRKANGPKNAWFNKGEAWFFVSPAPVKKPAAGFELNSAQIAALEQSREVAERIQKRMPMRGER